MFETINLVKSVMTCDVSPAFLPYGKVIIHGLNGDYEAKLPNYSESTHRTMEVDCPITNLVGTDADYLLGSIGGLVYQPLEATGAIMNPAAQLGDKFVIDGTAAVMAELNTFYDHLCVADISSPADEEIDHEYQYDTQTERELNQRVIAGKEYKGASIDNENGFTAFSGNAKVVLNAEELAFYSGNTKKLYFDPVNGKYVFVGDVEIADGSLTIDKFSSTLVSRVDNLNIANGNFIGGTFINGRAIISPTIYSQDLIITPFTSQSGVLNNGTFTLRFAYNNVNYDAFKISYGGGNVIPYVNITSPANFDINLFGRWQFSNSTVSGLYVTIGGTNYPVRSG